MLGGKFPADTGDQHGKSKADAGQRYGRTLRFVRERLSGMCGRGHNSGDIARHRLKLLLASDKIRCSPRLIEMMKDDLIGVLSKYVEIDSGRVELGITKTAASGGETLPALFASIPIRAISDKGIE